jgi:hypothetical protein
VFLIDDLLLAPGSFVIWVMRKVHEAAKEELEKDVAQITTDLTELHRRLETGAITESEFDATETKLLDRLDQLNQQAEDADGVEEIDDHEE